MTRILVLALVALFPAVARADDEAGKYVPLGFGLPQIGLGMVARGDNDMELPRSQFDGTIRYSPGKAVLPRLHLGGFVEARTAGFDTMEFGVGPQAMFSISELWAVQLRGGVAAVADGPSYALAGIQIGNAIVGVTFTGRRFFDDDHLELSVNLELTSGLLLVPFLVPVTR